MVHKVTLDLKVKACSHCKHADQTKLRQKRKNYCSDFSAHNGHCKNFEK